MRTAGWQVGVTLGVVVAAAGCGVRGASTDLAPDASSPAVSEEVNSRELHVSPPSGDPARLTERDGRRATWTATNVRGGFVASVDAAGAALRPAPGAAWSLGLRLAGVGRTRVPTPLGVAAMRERDGRVELVHEQSLIEWYGHDARGLEQGFDLPTRLPGDGGLVLRVAVDGLAPVRAPDGASVELREAHGRAVLRYGQLQVVDADGRSVPASLEVEGATIALRVDDAKARYPLVIDPLVWAQQAELLASDGAILDYLGSAVSLSGDTALVGAYRKTIAGNSQQGAAYVFVRSGGVWTQQAELLAPDGAAGDNFGGAVAVVGDTAVVGAGSATVAGKAQQGAGYVFVRSGSSWTFQAKLVASDGAASDDMGWSAALGTDTVILGANQQSVALPGAAWVFVRSGTSWSQQAKLVSSDGAVSDFFGGAVAISLNTAVVGAFGKNSQTGAAYVFGRSGASWSQQTKLVPFDGAAGDYFGMAVAVAGSTVAVGSPSNSGSGAAYVFVGAGSSWPMQQKLIGADAATGDTFGGSTAVQGDVLLIGASSKGLTFPGQGVAYLFGRAGTIWTQQRELLASDPSNNDQLGTSVGLDGNTALVGARYKYLGGKRLGAAYAFALSSSNGDACASAAACGSGHCVDGVCCDTACAGLCQACVAAKKGSGADGVCSNVAAGTNPDADCPGVTCSFGVQEDGHVCDGSGACQATTTTVCGDYVCGASACNTTCLSDADCQPTAYCAADSTCRPRKATGAACNVTTDCRGGACNECQSGHCADGVCCATACTGVCAQCNGATPGTCTNVPKNVAPAGGHGSCAGSGSCAQLCDGAGACGYPGSELQCQAGSCTGGGFLTPKHCDGAGGCGTSTLVPCGAYACTSLGCFSSCSATTPCASGFYCTAAGTCQAVQGLGSSCTSGLGCTSGFCVDGVCCGAAACASPATCNVPGALGACTVGSGGSCTSSAVCASNAFCSGGVCVAQLPRGGACAASRDCASGFCVDGVCCDRACDGQCEACDVASARGTCQTVTGAPHGARTACIGVGAGASCGIQCTGLDPKACGYPSTAVVCASNGCAGGVETHAAFCDGAGSCPSSSHACGAFACGTGACNTSCSADADCAAGDFCQAPSCVSARPLGAACARAGECASGACVDGVCCSTPSCGVGSSCATAGHVGSCTKTVGASCVGDGECGSGHCADGVCCDAACTGTCEACDGTTIGHCAVIAGAPHGTRAKCPSGGGDACKVSQCDGATTDHCAALPGHETVCAPASCTAANVTTASTCDGSGGCSGAQTTACAGGYACDGAACRTTCANDADCAEGNACSSGRCAPRATPTCSSDGTASVPPTGTPIPCGDFRCDGVTGSCRSQCADDAQCAVGRVCETNGVCAPPAPAASSCACDAPGGGSRPEGLALLSIAIACVFVRRRRRSARSVDAGVS